MIDSHAHLDSSEFDPDRDEVIRRAYDAGVLLILNVGADLTSSQDTLALTERYPFVYAAVGVHPHAATELNDAALAWLREAARHPRVVAIGEVGLDYYRNLSPRTVQTTAFERQLELAYELGKPVVLHDREAHDDVLAALERWKGRLRGVLHCFSGDVRMALRAVELGWYIGVDGPLTFRNARKLPEVVRAVPLSRLLVETDCPYLTPYPYRGRRNEPAYVILVAQAVAAVKNLSLEEVDRAMSENARELFGLDIAEANSRKENS